MFRRKKNTRQPALNYFESLPEELLPFIFSDFKKAELNECALVDKRFARGVQKVRDQRLDVYQQGNVHDKICSALIVASDTYLKYYFSSTQTTYFRYGFDLFSAFMHGDSGRQRANSVKKIAQQLKGEKSSEILILIIMNAIILFKNNQSKPIAFVDEFIFPCLNQFKITDKENLSLDEMVNVMKAALQQNKNELINKGLKKENTTTIDLSQREELDRIMHDHIRLIEIVFKNSLKNAYYLERLLSYTNQFDANDFLNENSPFIVEIKKDYTKIEEELMTETHPAWPTLI